MFAAKEVRLFSSGDSWEDTDPDDIINDLNQVFDVIKYKTTNDLRAKEAVFVGVDFDSRARQVKWDMCFSPNTRAEKTIYWFLYGRKYSPYPQHLNCRCQSNIILQSKDELK